MFETARNNNIIPHIWKLATILYIPNPNKEIEKGPSYTPLSPISVIAYTKEEYFFYIITNISNTPTQYEYKTQHSTVTVLHTPNNTVARGFNEMATSARTITVALDMRKNFRHNKHTHTNQKDNTDHHSKHNHEAHRTTFRDTTYINHTFIQRQCKTGVPQN